MDAVAAQGPMGQQLGAFFGCIYHAGLRPSEPVVLTRDEIDLLDTGRDWGWLYLGDSAPSAAEHGMTPAPAASDASSSTAPSRKSAPSPSRPPSAA